MIEWGDMDQWMPGKSEDSDPSRLPLDSVFEVLKNERRRITIRYLREEDNPVELRDLAEHIASQERIPEELISAVRKRIYVSLYQTHLPKMDELGVVEFNRDRGLIDRGPNFAQVEAYLDGPDESSPTRWPQYYLAVAVINVTLFAGWIAAVIVVEARLSIPVPAVVGLLVTLPFATLALVQQRSWQDGESDTDRSGD